MFMGRALAGVAALLLLSGCGGQEAQSTAAGQEGPSETAATEASTPTPSYDEMTAESFQLKVKVKEKKCFGSAGCNVTYVVVPTYMGDATGIDPSGQWDVTYTVTGLEDEQIGTLRITGSKVTQTEERGQVGSSAATLTAEVTDVTRTS